MEWFIAAWTGVLPEQIDCAAGGDASGGADHPVAGAQHAHAGGRARRVKPQPWPGNIGGQGRRLIEHQEGIVVRGALAEALIEIRRGGRVAAPATALAEKGARHEGGTERRRRWIRVAAPAGDEAIAVTDQTFGCQHHMGCGQCQIR
jgi:hypothetical protein